MGMVECQRSGRDTSEPGGMAEWTKAAVLKTAVGLHPPGVRIPLPPPQQPNKWGGAGVVERGRLLSACRGKTLPWVRIPPSPPEVG